MNSEKAFFLWYNNEATLEERTLFDRVDSFGYLFEDMLFRPGTSSYELTKYKLVDDGQEVITSDSMPSQLEYFSYSQFRYKVEQPDDCIGYFSAQDLLLCVSPAAKDSTVLHEMIHLHEHVINELPMYWHDTFFWAIYSNLRSKIPNLDSIITEHAHVLNEAFLYEEGGLHDILFLLKSFDIDSRMGYSLGTVFSYGRTDIFNNSTSKRKTPGD